MSTGAAVVGIAANNARLIGDGVAAPCGITMIFGGSTSNPATRRRGVSVMTTIVSAEPRRLEHVALPGGRVGADRVGDDDDRHGDAPQLEHDSPSAPVVHAVLVLDDGHVRAFSAAIAAATPASRSVQRRPAPGHPRDRSGFAGPHHVDGRSAGDQTRRQRRRERGDATRGRRKRRQHPEASERSPRIDGRRGNEGPRRDSRGSARTRRRACDGRQDRDGRPAQAGRTLPRGGRTTLLGRCRIGLGNLLRSCSQPGQRSCFSTSHRRPGTDLLANAATQLRALGAVRLVAGGRSRRRWSRRHAVRHRRLGHGGHAARHGCLRMVRGSDDRSEGGGVPAHRRGVRAGRRIRHHPQRIRLPAAHVQRSRRHSGRHDDPRLLVRADRPGVRALRRHDHLCGDQRRRSPPGAALRGNDPPRHRHRRLPVDPEPDDHLLFFGRIHPDKGTAHAIDVAARAGRRLDIAGIIQDQEYFTYRSSRTSTANTSATSAR